MLNALPVITHRPESSGAARTRPAASGEIGHALPARPGVVEAVVVGIADPRSGQRIVACVVGDIDDPEQLSAFVTGHLAFHMRPRQIHFVDALPRNAMGKVQQKLLTG